MSSLKALGVSRKRVNLKEHRGEYPVSLLCETLEVSVSGYYDWRKRPVNQHAQADARLAEQIQSAITLIEGSMVALVCM